MKKIIYIAIFFQILLLEMIGGFSEIKYHNIRIGSNEEIKYINLLIMFTTLLINLYILDLEKKLLKKHINIKVLNKYTYVYLVLKLLVIILAIFLIKDQTIMNIEDIH